MVSYNGNSLNEGRFSLIRVALEEWYEGVCESYHAHVVDRYFMLNLPNIDSMGFAEVHDKLNTCVQKDAVEIWM